MTSKTLAAAAAAALMVIASPGAAQTTVSDVVIQAPLNLDTLSPEITSVAVTCVVYNQSNREVGRQKEEIPVMGGVVAATLTVKVGVDTAGGAMGIIPPINPGDHLMYMCELSGYSAALRIWDAFSETHKVEAFRLKPTPVPQGGTFVW